MNSKHIIFLVTLVILNIPNIQASNKAKILKRFSSCDEKLLQSTQSNRMVFQRRSIEGYERMLGKALFRNALLKLSSGDTWIDMGAGRAKAMLAYYLELKSKSQLKRLPKMIAVSLSGKGHLISAITKNDFKGLNRISRMRPELRAIIKNLNTIRKFAKFSYIEADASSGTIHKMHLPKAKLITDVWGPLAYTNQADRVLNEYLKLLCVGGEILIHMHWKRFPKIEIGNQTFEFLDWVASIQNGLKIEEIIDSPLSGTFRITKLKENAQIPLIESQ
jgi:hypothetical protein